MESEQKDISNYDLENTLDFWSNLQKAGALFVEISAMMQNVKQGDTPIDPLYVNESLANTWLNFWRDPDAAFAKQMKLWTGMQDIWSGYFLGAPNSDMKKEINHRRFSHSGWQENLVFAFMRSAYLFLQNWMDETLTHVDGLSAQEKIVAGLTTRNIVEAINPANFAITNPEVLDTTMKEKGANLVRGMEMMLADVKRGKGELLVRQVDPKAFEVGQNIAVTKGKVIFENGHFQILQYEAQTKKVRSKPILIVPPWINKYYILDLNEKKSFAKWLVEQGNTVFMISWINADESTRDFTWESRLNAAREAIDVVCTECEVEKAHLISFCIGGTMVGSLLADMGKDAKKCIASSTFLTAQFDFEHAGELRAFVSGKSVDLLNQFGEQGYIPATSMSNAFNLLRSSDLIWSYIVNNYLLGKEPMAFDLLYWNSDSMAMPLKIQKYYLDEFYLKNAFMKNALPIGDHNVGVESIVIPTYHLAAIEDHIAPAASVFIAAKAMKNAEVRFVLSGSGHIAGVVNPPSLQKYQYWTGDHPSDDLTKWHQNATEHKGSWWSDWMNWLEGQGDALVTARTVGKKYAPIEAAPGGYVRKRFDV